MEELEVWVFLVVAGILAELWDEAEKRLKNVCEFEVGLVD